MTRTTGAQRCQDSYAAASLQGVVAAAGYPVHESPVPRHCHTPTDGRRVGQDW